MIIINKPESAPLFKAKCYKCNKILWINVMSNMESPFIKDCSLHNNTQVEGDDVINDLSGRFSEGIPVK